MKVEGFFCGPFKFFFSVWCLVCLCTRMFIGALWLPAGLGKGVWCLTVSLFLSHWYPGSGVVFVCIDS